MPYGDEDKVENSGARLMAQQDGHTFCLTQTSLVCLNDVVSILPCGDTAKHQIIFRNKEYPLVVDSHVALDLLGPLYKRGCA